MSNAQRPEADVAPIWVVLAAGDCAVAHLATAVFVDEFDAGQFIAAFS